MTDLYTGRETATPCLNQSLTEFFRGDHMTWNVDRICDRCKSSAATSPGRGEAGERHGMDSSPASSSLAAPFPRAGRDALQSAAEGVPPHPRHLSA